MINKPHCFIPSLVRIGFQLLTAIGQATKRFLLTACLASLVGTSAASETIVTLVSSNDGNQGSDRYGFSYGWETSAFDSGSPSIWVGHWYDSGSANGSSRVGYLQANLSGLPPAGTITSAKLYLYITGYDNATTPVATLTHVNSATATGDASQKLSDASVPVGASHTINYADGTGWLAFDFTADVVNDLNAGYAHAAFRMAYVSSYRGLTFRSADYPDPAFRPYLVVNDEVNVAPTFVTSSPVLTVAEDASATSINSLLGVVDTNTSQTLTWSVTTMPTKGTLAGFPATASTAGNDTPIDPASLTYTPNANQFGSDTFTIQVSDGTATGSITVNTTITAGNDPPTATDDGFTVAEDSAASSLDVLANDTSAPDGVETLTVTAVTQPANGTVTFTARNVSFTPAANFNGATTFTYTISDGNGGTATATVTVTVAAVNDPPTANGDTLTIAEESAATPVNVLANDTTGPDTGETLTVTAVTQPAAGGSVTLVGGVVRFTPASNFNGATTFTYTINDGNGGTANATVTVTVTDVNDPPTAVSDSATVAENSSATVINVLANDTSAPDGVETLTVTAVTQPANGTVTFTATNVSFTPAANFNGATTFTYTISDGNGGTATATVTVTVAAVADTPTVTNAATNEDTQTAAGLVITRAAVDGPEVTHVKVTAITNGRLYKNNGTTEIVSGTFITVAEGSAGLKFTPDANENSSSGGPFTFAVQAATDASGGGLSALAATASITVTSVNDAPTAIALSASSVNQSGGVNAIVGTLSAEDIDDTVFTFTLVAGPGSTGNAFFAISGTTLRANDAAALSAGLYSVRVQADDAHPGGTYSTIVTVTVIDDVAPAAPSAPDLIPSSDSGVSSSDNLTAVTMPTFTGTAEANSTVQLFRSGTTVIGTSTADGSGNWSVTLGTALADGTHSITAKVVDGATNTSVASAPLSLTIDTTASTAPAFIAITDDTGTSSTDQITSDTTLELFGATAPNETLTVYRNATLIGTVTANGSGTWSLDYTGTVLASGTHTFTATTTDQAGNTSVTSAEFFVEIDLSTPSAPVITGISNDTGVSTTDGVTNDATLVISGTADANATITVSRNGVGAIGTTIADGSGAWTFDFSATTLPDGSYIFTAFATDAAGNPSSVSADFPVTVDTTAPVISTQPEGGTYVAGGSFVMGVVATDATALSYQWYLGAEALGNTSNRTGALIATVTHTGIGVIGFSGSYTVRLTDLAGNSTTSNAAVIVVNKATQTIDFAVIADRLATATPFAIDATASTGFPVTFSVVSGPATINGNTVTLTGAGPVRVRATQAGDLNHESAFFDRAFTVTKASATVTLGNLAQTFDGSAKPISVTTSPAGLNVVFTYSGEATPPSNAGSYTVVATIDDVRYQGTATDTLVIGKASQGITFTPVGSVTVGTPVALVATANSGLAVTFSLISGNATVSGTSFTANDANPIILRAAQAGNSNYNPATSDQVVANITKLAQTISFGALADRSHTDAAFTLSATASSSLPVAFAVQNGPATLSGNTLTLAGTPGVVTIVARQPGSAAYSAAPEITRSFAVSAASTAPAPDGVAAAVTGGSGPGSLAITVSTTAEFIAAATSSSPTVITVVGTLNVGAVNVTSNKTIQGADENATLVGSLNLGGGVNNVIIRGLNLSNPGTTIVDGVYADGGSGLVLSGAANVFLTHLTFFDCADHHLRIVNGADNIAVSWCEFYSTSASLLHRHSVQIGSSSETRALNVTMHHNVWGNNIDQGMPLVTWGNVHLFNNLFTSTSNTTGTVVAGNSQVLSERNVYSGVTSPLVKLTVTGTAGRICSTGNVYTSCTGDAPAAGTDAVLAPSYSYEMLPASDVALELAAKAGNTAGFAYTNDATGSATITGPTSAVAWNAPFTLSAVATGFTPSTYQWRKDNVNITGANAATYTVANGRPDNAGNYTVAITLLSGDTVMSAPLTVAVNSEPPAPVASSRKGGGGALSAWALAALLTAFAMRTFRPRKR